MARSRGENMADFPELSPSALKCRRPERREGSASVSMLVLFVNHPLLAALIVRMRSKARLTRSPPSIRHLVLGS